MGNRSTTPASVFVGDQLKGQDPTVSSWFPNIGKHDCVFHLIENMKEPKNGGANANEIHLFQKLIHSANAIDANANETNSGTTEAGGGPDGSLHEVDDSYAAEWYVGAINNNEEGKK